MHGGEGALTRKWFAEKSERLCWLLGRKNNGTCQQDSSTERETLELRTRGNALRVIGALPVLTSRKAVSARHIIAPKEGVGAGSPASLDVPTPARRTGTVRTPFGGSVTPTLAIPSGCDPADIRRRSGKPQSC